MMRLTVHVRPNAKATKVLRWEADVLHLSVTASPSDGKANEAVILLVAQTLGVAKSAIDIVRGHHARVKVLTVDGVDEATVQGKLASLGAGTG